MERCVVKSVWVGWDGVGGRGEIGSCVTQDVKSENERRKVPGGTRQRDNTRQHGTTQYNATQDNTTRHNMTGGTEQNKEERRKEEGERG
jgi:hypothetical protein